MLPFAANGAIIAVGGFRNALKLLFRRRRVWFLGGDLLYRLLGEEAPAHLQGMSALLILRSIHRTPSSWRAVSLLKLASRFDGATESDLVDEIELAADGHAASQARDGYLKRFHHAGDIGRRGLAFNIWVRSENDLADILGGKAPQDRKSTRLNSSHEIPSRMPSSA